MLLKDKRIFITEDNLTNRSVMQLLLEREGATIEFERWGRDTVTKLRAFAPVDLVILDLMFPDGISGFDVYEQIRTMKDFDGVPIIAVSAKEPDEAIPETQAKGFLGFISKPIDHRRFAHQIVKLIRGEAVWHAR